MPNPNTKGISVHVDRGLHAEITAYLQENNMKMGDFIAQAAQDELHPKISEEELLQKQSEQEQADKEEEQDEGLSEDGKAPVSEDFPENEYGDEPEDEEDQEFGGMSM